MWTSARGVARQWRDQGLVNRGFLRNISPGSAVFTSTGPDEPIVEAMLDVATDQHGRRRRVDARSRRGDEWLPDTVVVEGDTYWARTGATVQTNGGSPNNTIGGTEIVALLLPAAVPAGFDLVETGERGEVAGRACTIAVATPREPDEYGHTPSAEVFDMADGGDEFRLSIDIETGVLLRVVKYVDGEVAEISEFTEIAFDEPLDDALFAPLR